MVCFPPKYSYSVCVVSGYGRTVLSAPPCVSLRAMKNGRPRPTLSLPGAAIYASASQGQFSRPMTGHTPQKLPALAAISCIIAVRVVIPTALMYNITPPLTCQALFREKHQNLCLLFGQNRDLVSCTATRYFWHLFRGAMKHFSFPYANTTKKAPLSRRDGGAVSVADCGGCLTSWKLPQNFFCCP